MRPWPTCKTRPLVVFEMAHGMNFSRVFNAESAKPAAHLQKEAHQLLLIRRADAMAFDIKMLRASAGEPRPA